MAKTQSRTKMRHQRKMRRHPRQKLFGSLAISGVRRRLVRNAQVLRNISKELYRKFENDRLISLQDCGGVNLAAGRRFAELNGKGARLSSDSRFQAKAVLHAQQLPFLRAAIDP